MSLLAGSDGTLWIGTDRGLVSWKGEAVVHYGELKGRRIAMSLQDRQGSIWLTTYSIATGWTLCEVLQRRVQCHGEDGGPGAGAIGLYEDRRGHLWVGGLDGVWHWKPGPPTFTPLTRQINGILALSETDDGALLAGANGGVMRLASGQAQPMYRLPAAIQPPSVYSMLRDRDGGLWIGTVSSGLVHIHRGIVDVFTKADGLTADSFSRLFEDREGSIWVVTPDGLDRFRDPPVVSFSSRQGLSAAGGQSVLASRDGSLWVGTLDGMNRLDSNGVTMYRVERPVSTLSLAPARGSRPVRYVIDGEWTSVHSMFQDSLGRIWISTRQRIGHFTGDRVVPVRGLHGGSTRAIVEDSQGVWVVRDGAPLSHVSRTTGRVQLISLDTLANDDTVLAAAADPEQPGIWLGFAYGGVVHVVNGRPRVVYGTADGLGQGMVRQLRLDADGALWAATEGGVSRLKDGRVATLSSTNGLPCDSIQWSLDDDARSLWIGTTCGLVRIARADLDGWVARVDRDGTALGSVSTTVLDAGDGFATSPAMYYTTAAVKATDGRLWFVGRDGVSVVDPQHVPVNTLPPPVQIEQVTADRRPYDPAAFANRQVRLPARTRDLQIDYTALSFVAPEKIRFRYRLENHDGDWQEAGARRQAFYNDLSPGNYRFRVIAANNSGVWNETGAFLDFSIAPAYYQTNWFRAAAIVTVVIGMVTAYRFRLRQVAQDFNMRLDERVNERTRIARELHDTLLQSFQGLMLRFQSARDLLPGQPAKAVEALDGALDRADQAIAEGRDAIQNLRSSTTVSNELAQAITTLADELNNGSDGKKASVHFSMSVEGSPRDLHPIVRDDIHRIAREALRNAFRHAQAERVEAEVTYGARELRLRIRDDGKGIDAQHLSEGRAKHWGLAGMRERALQIGGRLDLWSEVGAGTEVELRVPGSVAYASPGGSRGAFRSFRKEGGGS